MIASKEMRTAWADYQNFCLKSRRDIIPSLTSFAAGWNKAMESIKQPVGNVYDFDLQTPKQPTIGFTRYVVAHYTVPDSVFYPVIMDGNGTPCYLSRTSDLSNRFYPTRQRARQDASDFTSNDVSVWKVVVSTDRNPSTQHILKWIKKNP